MAVYCHILSCFIFAGGVSDCSAGWLNFQESCYRFNTYPLQWDKAAVSNCLVVNRHFSWTFCKQC